MDRPGPKQTLSNPITSTLRTYYNEKQYDCDSYYNLKLSDGQKLTFQIEWTNNQEIDRPPSSTFLYVSVDPWDQPAKIKETGGPEWTMNTKLETRRDSRQWLGDISADQHFVTLRVSRPRFEARGWKTQNLNQSPTGPSVELVRGNFYLVSKIHRIIYWLQVQ